MEDEGQDKEEQDEQEGWDWLVTCERVQSSTRTILSATRESNRTYQVASFPTVPRQKAA
jgi:hypothetical protein